MLATQGGRPRPRIAPVSPPASRQCTLPHHPPPQPTASAAHIPLFLYPFLNTSIKNRPFEYLRLTSLGVIGALVKVRGGSGVGA
jgi:hypothetical protein